MFVDDRGAAPMSLATINTDGSDLRRVVVPAVPHSLAPQWPAWSRDSRRIAFIRFSGGIEPRSGLYVADADGSHQRRILAAPKFRVLEQPRWAPDGRRIAFSQGNVGVSVVNSDGSARRVVLRNTDRKRVWIGSIDWSPDGRRLVVGLSDEGAGSLVIVNSDGSNPTSIAEVPLLQESAGVAWSPDGRQLAYIAADHHGWSLWTIGADGTNPRRVHSFPRSRSAVRSLDWQPKKKR
jgi:tricorn protease